MLEAVRSGLEGPPVRVVIQVTQEPLALSASLAYQVMLDPRGLKELLGRKGRLDLGVLRA